MNNNLTLSVTLTGDGRQLSGTLQDARADVREFGTTTDRESRKADTALTAPGRSAVTVSEHLREAGREARTFGTETAQGGREASQALSQTSGEAQTVTGHLDQLRTVAAGVGVALATIGARDFVMNAYAAVSSSQQLQGSLKTVTGSIENASAAWDTLLGFAAETPFTLDQSVQAFIRMQSLGLNPSLEALRSYGNTASAMGKDMMQMVEAVADATTGEFERLKEFGIRASKEGEQISFTFQGVTTTVANSAAAISQYLQQIGENQFAGAMGDQMDTLSGKASNLEDTIYQFYLAVGDAGAADIFESTLANASNTVQFLTDNIDTLASGAEVMAALIGGRVVVAVANVTAAKLAATQQTVAYQMALARMAGVSTTAAAGQTALAAATRGASAAMALVGGPLGAAMLAGGAIYYFREELGLVTPKVQSATDRVDDMTSALDANSEAALKNARAMLEAERQFQQFQQARLAMEVNRQQQVVADEQEQWDAVGSQQAFGMGMRSEAQQKLHDLRLELLDTRQAIEAAGGSVTEIDEKLAELERTTREVITPTTDLGDANETAAAKAKTLADAAEAQADALDDLRNRLIPGRRETVQLARDVGTLTTAMAMGTGGVGQHIQSMQLLALEYISTQDETDELAKKTQDAAFTMEGAFDELRLNGLRRLDDGFADLWQGAIDGSLNASEIMKRALDQTLAEMAHMAITRPIVVQLQGMMGMGGGSGSASAGGGMGGFDLSPGGIANAWNMVQNGFGGNSIGQGITSVARSGYGALTGNAVSYGGTGWASSATAGNASWLNNPSNVSNISMGLQSIGGSYVGNELGSSMFGKQANSNIGSTVGAIAGSFLPIPGGTFIGATLGGMVDSLFGSDSDPRAYYTTGDDVNWGGYGSPFGEWGFHAQDMSTEDMEGLGELAKGMTELDMALASMMTDDQIASATQRMVEFNANTGEILGSLEQMSRDRLATIMDGVTDYTDQLTAQNASLEGLAEASVNVLQFSNAVDEFNAQIQADAAALLQSSDNVGAQAAGLVTALNAVELLDNGVERMGFTFDSAAEGAIHHAYALQEAAGGMENLNALTSSYYQNYFTEAEREAQLREDLTESMRELGFELPRTRQGFRDLVEAQNQNTAAGAETFLALLNLEGAFAQLVPAADTAASSVASAADALAPVKTAWETLNESVDAERQILDAAYRDTTASIRSNMSVVQDAMRETESASRSLQNALRQTQSGTAFAREQGQATLRRMLAAGEITDQRELDNALQAVAEPSENLFGSFLDYQRDFVGTAHDIYNLSQLTDDQLSTEEQSLAALEKQLRNAEVQHSQEMAKYDRLLMDQAAIIEAEVGTQSWLSSVNDSVLSVEEAVRNIRISIPSGGGGGGGGGNYHLIDDTSGLSQQEQAINDIYQEVLGRNADSQGLGYWMGDLSNGHSLDDIRNSIEQNKLNGSHADGLWNVPFDGYIAELHKGEMVAPAETAERLRTLPYQGLPMPSLPPMPFFNQPTTVSGDMAVLVKRIEALTEHTKTQGGMQREALKALKALVRQLERWDDQDRVRVSVEKTVEPTA